MSALQVSSPSTIIFAGNQGLFVLTDPTASQNTDHIEWELLISKDNGVTFSALPTWCTPFYLSPQSGELVTYSDLAAILPSYTWQNEGQPFVPDCGVGDTVFVDNDTLLSYELKYRTIERSGTTPPPQESFGVKYAANGSTCPAFPTQQSNLSGLPMWLTNQPNGLTFSCGQPLWLSVILALPSLAYPIKIKVNRYFTDGSASIGEVVKYINLPDTEPYTRKYHIRADLNAYNLPTNGLSRYEFYLSDTNDNVLTDIRLFYLEACCRGTDRFLLFWNSKGGFDNLLIKDYQTSTNSETATAERAFDPLFAPQVGSYKPYQIGKTYNYCAHTTDSYTASMPTLKWCDRNYTKEVLMTKWAAFIMSKANCSSCNMGRQCYYLPIYFPSQQTDLFLDSPHLYAPKITIVTANENTTFC